MYDTQAMQAGAAQYAVQGTNLGQTPKPLIADAMLRELNILLEKANGIANRQYALKERIFGSVPTNEGIGKEQAVQNGFLHEANNKIQSLNITLDRISMVLNELEKLA